MIEAKKEGKIKSIGISNFRPDRLVDLCMNQEDKPVINQIEINPFDQNYEEERIMRKYGVHPEAWAPFAEGKNDIDTGSSQFFNHYDPATVEMLNNLHRN